MRTLRGIGTGVEAHNEARRVTPLYQWTPVGYVCLDLIGAADGSRAARVFAFRLGNGREREIAGSLDSGWRGRIRDCHTDRHGARRGRRGDGEAVRVERGATIRPDSARNLVGRRRAPSHCRRDLVRFRQRLLVSKGPGDVVPCAGDQHRRPGFENYITLCAEHHREVEKATRGSTPRR